jgi:Leucine Rich repeat
MTETRTQPSSESTTPRSKRIWLQFNLRMMLVVTLVVGSGLGWIAYERRKNAKISADVDSLKRLRCLVKFSENEPRELELIAWLTGRSLSTPVVSVSAVVAPGSKLFGLKQVQDSDLTYLKGFSHLETLQLGSTKVSDSGLVHIRGLRRLKELDLTFTSISDNGLKQIRRLTRLEDLDVSYTSISDGAVEHLRCLQSLKFLNVRNTRISIVGVAELQKTLPNCQIQHNAKD